MCQKENVITILIIVESVQVIPKYVHSSLKSLNLHPLTHIDLPKAVLNKAAIVCEFQKNEQSKLF